MPSNTGVWTKEEANEHIFSYRLAEYLRTILKTGVVIDFGCGYGTYLKYLMDTGFYGHLVGVEGSLLDYEIHNIVNHDLTNNIDLHLKGHVICLEVAEHIPVEYESVFVDNLVRHVDGYLIISWAVPYQDGIGHVNCQTNEYVIDLFKSKGFEYLEDKTIRARMVIENHVAWFKDTILIFNNGQVK